MKTFPVAHAAVLALSLFSAANAATITNTLVGLPPQPQCNEAWTNQNVILRFSETIASEDFTGGSCSFQTGSGFVWLYPSRLLLDFSLLRHRVTRVEADVYDQCGAGCTKVFAYSGGSLIGAVGNASTQGQTLSLTFDALHPDSCAIRSFEAKVNEIRISTEDEAVPALSVEAAVGSISVSWPTNATSYVLETTEFLASSSTWTSETNNIQLEGSAFVYRTAAPAGSSRFFRLRHD